MFVRSATKGFKETKTCKCIEEGTRCHGSCWREKHKKWGRGFLFVQSQAACTMTLVMLWEILLVSKSTLEGSTATTSSGFVTSAIKDMLFNLITKHISKLVVLEAILVTVVECFPGPSLSPKFIPFLILSIKP